MAFRVMLRELDALDTVVVVTTISREEIMYKFAIAILLLSAPAFADNAIADPAALQKCPPIGQTAKGELIYSLDCKAITTDYTVGENKPNMAKTYMKDTVIPKSGGEQTPEKTPTTAAEVPKH
jgi:hypothetical protein